MMFSSNTQICVLGKVILRKFQENFQWNSIVDFEEHAALQGITFSKLVGICNLTELSSNLCKQTEKVLVHHIWALLSLLCCKLNFQKLYVIFYLFSFRRLFTASTHVMGKLNPSENALSAGMREILWQSWSFSRLTWKDSFDLYSD